MRLISTCGGDAALAASITVDGSVPLCAGRWSTRLRPRSAFIRITKPPRRRGIELRSIAPDRTRRSSWINAVVLHRADEVEAAPSSASGHRRGRRRTALAYRDDGDHRQRPGLDGRDLYPGSPRRRAGRDPDLRLTLENGADAPAPAERHPSSTLRITARRADRSRTTGDRPGLNRWHALTGRSPTGLRSERGNPARSDRPTARLSPVPRWHR